MEELLDHWKTDHSFSLKNLAWAIQSHVDVKCIERYLEGFDRAHIQGKLLDAILPTSKGGARFPILFFAAEQNSPEIVTMLCQRGADVDRRLEPSGIPLLAYTTISSEYSLSDTTDTLVALLAMGANPRDIPRDMWCDYATSVKNENPKDWHVEDPSTRWCTAELRGALSRTLTLMQRYFLWKADYIERPMPRKKQVAQAHKITPLFELPYRIIGQRWATENVEESISSHYLFNTAQPLVVLFTGPSGHGKTELASSLGDLLSLPFLAVNCSVLHHSTDLLGAHAPYQGWTQGTPLGAHLAQYVGQRNVVFLDEFDKTTEDVRQSLLLIFEGKYTDRRNNKPLDCSKCIWVLAANLGEQAISNFWDAHLKDRSEEEQKRAPFKELDRSLNQIVKSEFGSPLARRLTSVVPFLPFNKDEQTVAAYKFMRELWQEVRKPINVESKDLLRNVFLNFVDDGQIAKHLAAEYYDPQAGVSSLLRAMQKEIRARLPTAWSREEEIIVDEMNERPLPNYDVTVATTPKNDSEITVKRRGTRELQLRPELS